jgi:hypothetical protein
MMTKARAEKLAQLLTAVASVADAEGIEGGAELLTVAHRFLTAAHETAPQRPVDESGEGSVIRGGQKAPTGQSGGVAACAGARCSAEFVPRPASEGGPAQVWCSEACRLRHRQRGRRFA